MDGTAGVGDGQGGALVAALVAAAVAAGLGACASTPAPRVLARGTLAYAVAAAGDRLVSIELDERFAVIVRNPDSAAPLVRVDLGPAERDVPALATTGDRAWVGGADGTVRTVDLARGRVIATWPVGAAVTALAVHGDLVVVGDASGAVCLRRRDGALLHCAVVGARPVRSLATCDDALRVTSGDGPSAASTGWTLPALTRHTGVIPTCATVWANGELVVTGPTVELVRPSGRKRLATMGGPIRAVAVLPGGRLVIAAWVRALDNPSIIVLAPLN